MGQCVCRGFSDTHTHFRNRPCSLNVLTLEAGDVAKAATWPEGWNPSFAARPITKHCCGNETSSSTETTRMTRCVTFQCYIKPLCQILECNEVWKTILPSISFVYVVRYKSWENTNSVFLIMATSWLTFMCFVRNRYKLEGYKKRFDISFKKNKEVASRFIYCWLPQEGRVVCKIL